VLVSGAGSSWTPNNGLVVGEGGAGALMIDAGGTVSTGGFSRIGLHAASTGTVTVSGAGSNLTTDELAVGYNGTGTLLIEDGGSVSSVAMHHTL
jgi:T5SS/PEP-CTERM-associated repeat protein